MSSSNCRVISRSHPYSRKSFSAWFNASFWVECGMLMIVQTMTNDELPHMARQLAQPSVAHMALADTLDYDGENPLLMN
jgi:hypothetical protein